MPYYIGVSLQQDTVSFHAAGSSLDYVPQSILLCCSILRMFCLFRVFRPFRYTHTKLIYPHDDCLRLLNPELRSSRVLLSFGCHLRYRTTGHIGQLDNYASAFPRLTRGGNLFAKFYIQPVDDGNE